MAIFGGLPCGKPNAGVVPREIRRAFISKEMVNHGDKVNLHVETRNVPDGTAVLIEWREMRSTGPALNDKIFDKVEGQIDKCQFVEKDYEVDWGEKELKWYTGRFYFRVKIKDLKLESVSNVLHVDRGGFGFSG